MLFCKHDQRWDDHVTTHHVPGFLVRFQDAVFEPKVRALGVAIILLLELPEI